MIIVFNRNGPRPRGGHSFVYEEKSNRFLVFGGLTSGNEVEICVNDTYQLVIQDEVLFTFNEAISPGRLGYNCNKNDNNNDNNNHNNNNDNNNNNNRNNRTCSNPIQTTTGTNNNQHDSQYGSNSPSGPMAVWKKLDCSGNLPSPRWCHSSIIQGSDMIVFGGWSYERSVGISTGSNFLNDLYILNVSTLVWTKVNTFGCLPRPRCQCACFLYKSKERIIFNNNSQLNKINDIISNTINNNDNNDNNINYNHGYDNENSNNSNDDNNNVNNNENRKIFTTQPFTEIFNNKKSSMKDDKIDFKIFEKNGEHDIEKENTDLYFNLNQFSNILIDTDNDIIKNNGDIQKSSTHGKGNTTTTSTSSQHQKNSSSTSSSSSSSSFSSSPSSSSSSPPRPPPLPSSFSTSSLFSSKSWRQRIQHEGTDKLEYENIIFSEGSLPEEEEDSLKNCEQRFIRNEKNEEKINDIDFVDELRSSSSSNNETATSAAIIDNQRGEGNNYEGGNYNNDNDNNANEIDNSIIINSIFSDQNQNNNYNNINSNNSCSSSSSYSKKNDKTYNIDNGNYEKEVGDIEDGQPVSKGYMIIFGGSSHNQEVRK